MTFPIGHLWNIPGVEQLWNISGQMVGTEQKCQG